MCFARWQTPSLTCIVSLSPERVRDGFGKKIERGLAIARNKGIDVHQTIQAMKRLFCDAGDDHACIAMAHKSHILQMFAGQESSDVINVRLEANGRCERASIVFQAAEQRNPYLVASCAQFRKHKIPRGSCLPGTMD